MEIGGARKSESRKVEESRNRRRPEVLPNYAWRIRKEAFNELEQFLLKNIYLLHHPVVASSCRCEKYPKTKSLETNRYSTPLDREQVRSRHTRAPRLQPISKLLIILIFLFFDVELPAQTSRLVFLDSFSIKADFFTVDRLLQIYAVDSTGVLTKYTPEGQTQFIFSNRPSGDLSLVDATDPFNILLFYPDYQIIQLLDRTLSPTAERNLLSLGLIDVQVIAMGNDQHIWLYDQAAFKLYKLNPNGEISLESGDLSLVLAQPPQPTWLFVQNNYVFLYDPQQGLLQFDVFGQYLTRIDMKNLQALQLVGDQLFFLENPDLLGVYDRQSFRSSSLATPVKAEQFLWRKGSLYLQGEDKIWVLKLGE